MPKSTDWNSTNKGNNRYAKQSRHNCIQPDTHKPLDLGEYRLRKQQDERKRALTNVIESASKLDW